MESIIAKEVAKEVLETIGRGEIPVVSKIALKKGYSKATSKNPQQIKKASSYKQVMEENQQVVVERLEKERTEILKRMAKTRSKAKYRDLTYSLDIVTKNHQLLTGGKTENSGIGELAETLNSWINSNK